MKKISCIIPAYNEEKYIADVLRVVIAFVGKELFEVIVIDDCSTDSTKRIVCGFTVVQLIEHASNLGKSRSVADGIRAAQGEYILLLDADLVNINRQNIIDLIAPITTGSADVSLSFRKNAWPLFPFRQIDYLSGERLLPTQVLVPTLPEMSKLASYGLEVFLNRLIIQNKLRIAVVLWPNVENVFHTAKRGFFQGVRSISKVWFDVHKTVSIVEMYSQNIKMKRLLVRQRPTL